MKPNGAGGLQDLSWAVRVGEKAFCKIVFSETAVAYWGRKGCINLGKVGRGFQVIGWG